MKSGNFNFLEHSGPLQACNGTALPLHRMMLATWHDTSGDWAQIRLKIILCVDCVPLYWKFKMMLNGMWGALCLQQGSALMCLIPGTPILQILHLEMCSHDLILFIKIYGCQVRTDGWYVLQYFGGLPLLVLGTLHILAATTSSPLITPFGVSLPSHKQGPET